VGAGPALADITIARAGRRSGGAGGHERAFPDRRGAVVRLRSRGRLLSGASEGRTALCREIRGRDGQARRGGAGRGVQLARWRGGTMATDPVARRPRGACLKPRRPPLTPAQAEALDRSPHEPSRGPRGPHPRRGRDRRRRRCSSAASSRRPGSRSSAPFCTERRRRFLKTLRPAEARRTDRYGAVGIRDRPDRGGRPTRTPVKAGDAHARSWT